MTLRTLFIIIALAAWAGCDQQQEAQTENLHNITSFSLEDIPKLQLVRDESFRASQNAGINKIGDVEVDSLGNVYFVDEYELKIYTADSEGNPIGFMGRAGGRDGEFQKLGNINVVGNSLYGFDEDRKLMNGYSLEDLEFSRAAIFSGKDLMVDSLESALPFIAHAQPDGSFLVGFQVVESPTDRRLFFYKANAEGEIISNQIMSFQNKPFLVENGSNGMIILMMPYERETLMVNDSEGNIYTLFTDDFIIQKYDTGGTYLESWKYHFNKRKLNRSDAVDMFDDVDIRRAIRGADLPSYWPAVSKLLIDDEDRFWIATITGNLQNYRWYLINKEGNVEGTFEIPRATDIRAVGQGNAYAVEFDRRTYAEKVIRLQLQ